MKELKRKKIKIKNIIQLIKTFQKSMPTLLIILMNIIKTCQIFHHKYSSKVFNKDNNN